MASCISSEYRPTFTLRIIFKCKNRSPFEIRHVVYLFEA